MSRAQRLADFRAHLGERVARLTVAWITLEQGLPSASVHAELLRELHTLKGEASMLGFVAVADVVHALESAAEAAARAIPTASESDHFVSGLDLLGVLVVRDRYAPSPEADAFVAGELYDEVVSEPVGRAAPSAIGQVSFAASGAQLDHMRNLIGQLTLDLRHIRDASRDNPALSNAVERTEATIAALEQTTRTLRTMPVSTILEPFPRMCRDLARGLDKRVTFESSGGHIGADREILAALTEPLLHLVRNAIDHGVELPEQRRAAGKPEVACVRIAASVVNQTLCIEVSDDGAGVDVEALRARAVERNLLTATAAATLSEDAMLEYLFSPGMSTRDEVTRISGRGLGLDVVRETARSLGGTLAVGSGAGTGTRFRLTLPVSLAIAPLLRFQVGAGHYALPAQNVIAVIGDDGGISYPPAGRALQFRAKEIPLFDLAQVLNEPTSEADASTTKVIVVQAGPQRVALAGARNPRHFDGTLEAVGDIGERGRVIAGAVPLADGTRALLVDPAAIARTRRKRPTSYSPPNDLRGSGRTALVVDDSPVIRDVIADGLRSRGLTVIEAANGREALACLELMNAVDVIVTDVEMPVMTGLELLESLREGPRRGTPVVVVSSCDTEADEAAARTLGAVGYLAKDAYSEQVLWSLVARHLAK